MFARYVALGDSQTEGLNDGGEDTGYRGWADRLAEQMAVANPDVRYANLAVRGKRAAQIHEEQLEAAVALEPDVATVMGGLNDVLRPSFDAAVAVAHLDAMFAALRELGATVASATFPDISRIAPITARLLPRVLDLNAGIREAAARHDVELVDTFGEPVSIDRRMWSADRIHATPLGHERMAAAVAGALGLPGIADWTEPLPDLSPRTPGQALQSEIQFVRTFVVPWAGRRMRRRSSGDGRIAKRPTMERVQRRLTSERGSVEDTVESPT